MEYIKASEAAERFGISVHRVQELCKNGKIEGATRFGRDWMIPKNAEKPTDGRRKKSERDRESGEGSFYNMPMPRKSPFLHMTDLYHTPGKADECIEALSDNPEAQALLREGINYARGEVDEVYKHATSFLQSHSGFYAIVGAGKLLALCASWRGDINMWNEAKRHICQAPCKNEDDAEILSLALAAADSVLFDNGNYPEWFTRGNFEKLPGDSHPATKIYYARYLYMIAYGVATKQVEMEGVKGLSMMKLLPSTIEPMISQAVVDRTIVPEIHLRLTCATAYHNSGDDKHAIEHIDKAIALAMPDRLYGLLTSYWRMLDRLLEERLQIASPDACAKVKELYGVYSVGWSRLSGIVRHREVAYNLTAREREVAKLASFGFTTKEIAQVLYISESTVKQTVLKVVQKTGAKDRNDFSSVL
jgi:DNA-binding CsgD family transcriptional regulator